jgi:UDP-glucuronate 4-epimerase
VNEGSSGRRYLVTGAAGFIGSHLVEALLNRGDEVVAIDNFDTYYNPTVKRQNVAWALSRPQCTLLEGDIRDASFLVKVFDTGSFTGVVHLAARAGVRASIADPLLYESVNVSGTLGLLETLRSTGGANLVFASSSSVYGASSLPPFREEAAGDRPCSPYASTKRACELFCFTYFDLYGLDVTCLRFFSVYGPRQRPDMAIHKFAKLIDQNRPVPVFGDGSSQRDYTYVADVINGIILALDSSSGYRVYNLGTTALTRLGELVSSLAELLDKPLTVEYLPDQLGDVPLTHADITRAQRDLGYDPVVTIAEGLEHFVSWFKKYN